MTWMAEAGGEHAGHGLLPDGRMPGMATAEQVASLHALPVDEAEVRFLELMIDHHLAGVDMADAGLAVLAEPDPRMLAESIVTSQTSEVEVLRELLAARGAGGATGHGDHEDGSAHHHG